MDLVREALHVASRTVDASVAAAGAVGGAVAVQAVVVAPSRVWSAVSKAASAKAVGPFPRRRLRWLPSVWLDWWSAGCYCPSAQRCWVCII